MPTAICPVCHLEYEYTDARYDRCPVCVPKEELVKVFEDCELVDKLPDDD